MKRKVRVKNTGSIALKDRLGWAGLLAVEKCVRRVGKAHLLDRYAADARYYFSRKFNRVLIAPEMAQIMLTSRCNIRCKICDVWRQEFRSELSSDEVKDFIDQAIALGVRNIYMTGGEALLRPDIISLIDHAGFKGVETTINTNGSLIDDAMARSLVGSRLRNITFSIDGPDASVHDAVRGRGAFIKAIEGMDRINFYRAQYKRRYADGWESRMDVGIACVITKDNFDQFASMVDLALSKECCFIAFQPLIYNGNLLENKEIHSAFWLEREDVERLRRAFEELGVLKKKLEREITIAFTPEKTCQHYLRDRRVNSCFAGYNRIFLNPQGDVSFVCFESFGNIRQMRLRDLWYSSKAQDLRRQIAQCEVNCTQFCSERPESDDFGEIVGKWQRFLFDRRQRQSKR